MYKTLTRQDFQKALNLKEDETFDGVLTYGGWHIKENTEVAEKVFEKFGVLDERMSIGIYRGKKVLFAVTYGGPVTSEFVHIGALLGAKIAIHTGSFGGLQKGMGYNDILLPETCYPGDGTSKWYVKEGETVCASSEVIGWLEKKLEKEGINPHRGSFFTTSSMLAETWEDIERWNKEGFLGVDLETATVFAVAKHFNIKSAAILHLADNLIEKQTIFMFTEEQRKNRKEIKKFVMKMGLETIANFA